MRPLLITLVIATPFCIGVAKGESQATSVVPNNVLREPSQADRASIVALLAEQDRAWDAGNADAYTAKALPEVRLTNVVGAYSIGKDSLLGQVRRIFATIYKGSRAKTTVVHISMIGGDAAIVDTISELRDFAHPADASVVVNGATYSRLQETLVRIEGTWWVASLHNVFIKPEVVPKDLH